MKKFLMFLCAVTLVFGMVGAASAVSFDFDMGADSYVDTTGTANVLKMYAHINSNLDNIFYTLAEGDYYSFYFATIGTTEGWINNDDLNPGTLTASVDFDSPDLAPAIGGTTIGFSAKCFFTQGWNLSWNDPVVVDFGSGGQFAIELTDVGYQSWWWQGPDGSADVYATVTLNTNIAPVPEPSTILLMGVGLLGLLGYSRKRLSKKS